MSDEQRQEMRQMRSDRHQLLNDPNRHTSSAVIVPPTYYPAPPSYHHPPSYHQPPSVITLPPPPPLTAQQIAGLSNRQNPALYGPRCSSVTGSYGGSHPQPPYPPYPPPVYPPPGY
jgi:hypothetical protein